VSDIKTVVEIAIKKPKTVADLLVVLTYSLRPPRLGLGYLNHEARGCRRRSRTIGRLTQPIVDTTGIVEIVETVDITGITSSNPQIRRRRDRSITLLTQRSGARSIVPQDTI
jgi:hypothetical protein